MIKDFFVGLAGFLFLGFLALVVIGAVGGSFVGVTQLVDGLTVDQMVATDVAAGLVAANTATPEPGPSSTPTAYAPSPAAELAAPAEAAAVEAAPNGQVPWTSFSAEALVVLFDPSIKLAHYSAPPASFVGGDLDPLANGQEVTIVGLARTSAERLVMLATNGQVTYAPLMRDGRIVFIHATGEPVVTMERFDELLP